MSNPILPRCGSCRVPLTRPERAGLVRICAACKALYRRDYRADFKRFIVASQPADR